MNEKGDKEIIPTTIMSHASTVNPAFAMLAGMQLDVFTPLKNGPMNAETLAKALDVKTNKLIPLLYALVMADLLNVEKGIFSNTDEANRFLVRGNPTYIGAVSGFLGRRWHALLQSAETIRTGKPQVKLDWNTLDEEKLIEVLKDLHPTAIAAGRQLVKEYNLTGFNHLLDAGGGTGGLSIELCESLPDLKATVVDLPGIVPISQQFISETNMPERIRAIATDLVDSPPEGTYDLAVLRALIQTLSPDQAKSVLKNIAESMEPGGSIYIMGYVIDDTRLYPSTGVSFNLYSINIYEDGQAFTESEHRQWLTMAGFTDVSIRYEAMPYGISIVNARKA